MQNGGGFVLWLVLCASAFFVSYLLSFLAQRLSYAVGAVDYPDGVRKLHAMPMPRLGGVGIYLCFCACSLLYSSVGAVDAGISALCIFGGGAVVLIGAVDDVFNYSPIKKLSLGGTVALISAFLMRQRESAPALEALFHTLGCALFILLLMNAFNMVDGADGLCATLSLLPLSMMSHGSWLSGVLFFSVLGFLPRNIPAKIYLGESGSSLIGYICAVIFLSSEVGGECIFGFFVPLAEVITTVFRRVLSGRNPLSADRGHAHHKLSALGLGAHGVAAVMLLFAAFSAAGLCRVFGRI